MGILPERTPAPTPPWTEQQPQYHGYYWWKEQEDHQPQIVYVYGLDGAIRHPQVLKIGTIQTTLLKACQGYWIGPLTPPSP